MTRTTAFALAALMAATPLAAKPALRDQPEIYSGLMFLGIADEIRNECSDISAKMLTALSRVNQLKSLARKKGYSRDEVEDFVTSKDEKRRMARVATDWLAGKGVPKGDTAALCAFGRAEIARGSAIGTLLRAR